MIFLTSFAAEVMDKLIPFLPKKPSELSLLFIPTAGNPYKIKNWMSVDRNKLIDLGFKVTDFDIKGKSESDVKKALEKTDIVFVSGGNTFYLLDNIRKSGFDKVVKKIIKKGLIYIGSSAGSVVLGPNIEPIKYLDQQKDAPNLKDFSGLNIIDYVILPHTNQKKYDKDYKKLINEYKDKFTLKKLKDSQAIVIIGDEQKLIS